MSGAIALPRTPRVRPRPFEGWQSLAAVVAVAGALAVLAILLGWRGSDLPAQVFRAELVRRDGFVIWNSQWFGGHTTLGYSVLAPAVGAFTGPLVLGAVSGVVAAVLFERILRFSFGRAAWIGALWFAMGTVTNLIVGRTTYALGIALGLGAIYAMQRMHMTVAVLCALLCSLSSPLAGAFLAIAAVAVALADHDRRVGAIAMGAAALVPIAVTALLFPTSGVEPYEPWALVWDLTLFGLVAAALWRYKVVRYGAALFALAALGSYLVPTALGGNVSRLGQYVAGPVLACALLPRKRLLLLAAVGIPLLVWQWVPAVDGIAYARTDPSTRASYYEPLVNYLDAQTGPIGRVEVPSTYRHWEAAYVAPHVLLARGWERQLDIAYNKIFYSKQLLNAQSYERWLHTNGVAFVALPDAKLDDASTAERAMLIMGGLPYLREVWHDAHWRVWAVDGFHGLVQGNATLRELKPDRVALVVHKPGTVTLRVRASRHWTVHSPVDGPGCATSTKDGWTVLRNLPTGVVTLTQSLAGTPCASP